MDYEQITVETHDGVLLATLNRPDKLNAWTYRMSAELSHAVETLNGDDGLGAMVITGAGRGFCAGADIGAVFKDKAADERGDGGAGNWVRLLRSSKPVIAAVNGPSVGVGCTMILPCDVIFASEQAKFAMGFVKMGLVPELGSSHFLVQRMGFGAASEMCLTGKLYSGREAQAMGLVDHLVPHETLLDEALAMARLIAANPAPQLRWIKALLDQNGCEQDLDLAQRRELELLQQAYDTPEHQEAVAAFMEKRAPDFRAARARAGEA